MIEPNNDEVICPKCANQFGAISVNTQKELTAALARIAELEASVAEEEASFQLRWKADMRAIGRWQDATGRKLIWPDHTDLCIWLLEQLEAAAKRESVILQPYIEYSAGEGPGDKCWRVWAKVPVSEIRHNGRVKLATCDTEAEALEFIESCRPQSISDTDILHASYYRLLNRLHESAGLLTE